jgi:hypothetical protein
MTVVVLNSLFVTYFFCLGNAFFECVICKVTHSRHLATVFQSENRATAFILMHYETKSGTIHLITTFFIKMMAL